MCTLVETPKLRLQSIIVEVRHVRQAPAVLGPVFVQTKENVHCINAFVSV